jgi:RimJ/RimL family protein N-acetyltransferase
MEGSAYGRASGASVYDRPMTIILRDLEDADLDRLFDWERDEAAVEMAAFTRADPSDRDAFDAHYERVRHDPAVTLQAIDDGNGLVGTIASFTMDGDREVSYWIAPHRWGEGLASAALRVFLSLEVTRPLGARVAEHNLRSTAVLVRAGFVEIGSETSYADGLGRDVVEHIYRLAR